MRRFAFLILLIPTTVNAGTLVQSYGFRFQSHNTSYRGFDPLPPSLAPLNGIQFEANGVGSSDAYQLKNHSDHVVEFNVLTSDGFSTDAGSSIFTKIFPFTLAPGAFRNFGYDIGGFYQRSLLTNPAILDLYVTTGFAPLPGFGIGENVRVDNPDIDVFLLDTAVFPVWNGSIKATYYYGETFHSPEPTSMILFTIGIALVIYSCIVIGRKKNIQTGVDDRSAVVV